MARFHYLPADDRGKARVLEMLALQLPRYQETLEISDAELAVRQADAAAFLYVLFVQQQMQNNAQLWTALKNRLRDGAPGVKDVAHFPEAPPLPAPTPAAVVPGIIGRLTSLVGRIKSHRNYNEAIGLDLGIVGSERVDDPNAWKPLLTADLRAGCPVVHWSKGRSSALEIWADRGDGKGFSLFTIHTHPPCPDPSPLPAIASSAVWKYRAIYRLRDQQVGQWSEVLSIIVGG